MARLRYSDRKRLSETGTLGDLAHDRVPDELATAIRVIIEGADRRSAGLFHERLGRELMEHFGRDGQWFTFYLGGDVDAFLDAIEILAEQGTTGVFVIRDPSGRRGDNRIPIQDVEDRINRAFERFRFGYRIEGGEARKVGSPALEETVVGPTLLAVQRPGWEEADRSFREALAHQRAGETDDALTAANAAVEASLKAVGMRGGTLKELTRAFKGSGLVPGYLENVPELLEDLLERLHAARSVEGDAHGKSPGAAEVPQELADLAIYWAGAFIAYLANSSSAAPA
jgi:hypothetical protein